MPPMLWGCFRIRGKSCTRGGEIKCDTPPQLAVQEQAIRCGWNGKLEMGKLYTQVSPPPISGDTYVTLVIRRVLWHFNNCSIVCLLSCELSQWLIWLVEFLKTSLYCCMTQVWTYVCDWMIYVISVGLPLVPKWPGTSGLCISRICYCILAFARVYCCLQTDYDYGPISLTKISLHGRGRSPLWNRHCKATGVWEHLLWQGDLYMNQLTLIEYHHVATINTVFIRITLSDLWRDIRIKNATATSVMSCSYVTYRAHLLSQATHLSKNIYSQYVRKKNF